MTLIFFPFRYEFMRGGCFNEIALKEAVAQRWRIAWLHYQQQLACSWLFAPSWRDSPQSNARLRTFSMLVRTTKRIRLDFECQAFFHTLC